MIRFKLGLLTSDCTSYMCLWTTRWKKRARALRFQKTRSVSSFAFCVIA